MALPDGKKNFEDMFIRFDRMYERDRQTDRHRMTAKAALAQHRSAKTIMGVKADFKPITTWRNVLGF